MDRFGSNRPKRRTSLVAKEHGCYKIQIGALSEPRFDDEGQITEMKAEYTFFLSGRGANERREVLLSWLSSLVLLPNYQVCPRDLMTGS